MDRPSFRIAHLSDIHCNSSQKWKNVFQKVEDILAGLPQRPDLLIITGDLVDRPRQKHFNTLLPILKSLIDTINTKSGETGNVYILTVPGNHDYFGINGIRFIKKRSKNYSKFTKELENSTGHSQSDIQKDIFKKHKIALFLLDSNIVGRGELAMGRIENPNTKLNE